MYLYGEILDVDYQQAKIWYEKAADQNDPRAQAKLGVMYANCLGVNQDYQQSKSWFEKAAEQGHVDDQYNLGLIYENGEALVRIFIRRGFGMKRLLFKTMCRHSSILV